MRGSACTLSKIDTKNSSLIRSLRNMVHDLFDTMTAQAQKRQSGGDRHSVSLCATPPPKRSKLSRMISSSSESSMISCCDMDLYCTGGGNGTYTLLLRYPTVNRGVSRELPESSSQSSSPQSSSSPVAARAALSWSTTYDRCSTTGDAAAHNLLRGQQEEKVITPVLRSARLASRRAGALTSADQPVWQQDQGPSGCGTHQNNGKNAATLHPSTLQAPGQQARAQSQPPLVGAQVASSQSTVVVRRTAVKSSPHLRRLEGRAISAAAVAAAEAVAATSGAAAATVSTPSAAVAITPVAAAPAVEVAAAMPSCKAEDAFNPASASTANGGAKSADKVPRALLAEQGPAASGEAAALLLLRDGAATADDSASRPTCCPSVAPGPSAEYDAAEEETMALWHRASRFPQQSCSPSASCLSDETNDGSWEPEWFVV